MQLTITITEEQQLALDHVVYDIEDWVTNFIAERARTATDEIVKLTVDRCLSSGLAVPGTRTAIMQLAYAQNWIDRAQTRTQAQAVHT